MIFNLNNEFERDKYKQYVSNLYKKGGIVEVKRKSPQRSLAQNSYLHLLLGYFGSEYGISIDEAKVDIYKRTCNKEIYERYALNKNGQKMKYLRSSSELTSAEMTLSIERFRNWSAAVAGIYLPSPNEENFLAYCRQQIEKDREFL